MYAKVFIHYQSGSDGKRLINLGPTSAASISVLTEFNAKKFLLKTYIAI